ncbi:MAG: hypothetical protein ACREEM_56600, partial [Blastocatellia bacterium]
IQTALGHQDADGPLAQLDVFGLHVRMVESMFKTSFCAVPDFNRVELAMTSGLTMGSIGISMAAARAVCSFRQNALSQETASRVRTDADLRSGTLRQAYST